MILVIIIIDLILIAIAFRFGHAVGLSSGWSEGWNDCQFQHRENDVLGRLNRAIERDVQLHESFELIYVVDGWEVRYSPDDYNTYVEVQAPTPVEAIQKMFAEVRNNRGRT